MGVRGGFRHPKPAMNKNHRTNKNISKLEPIRGERAVAFPIADYPENMPNFEDIGNPDIDRYGRFMRLRRRA